MLIIKTYPSLKKPILLILILGMAYALPAKVINPYEGLHFGGGYQYMNIRNNPIYLPDKTFPPHHALGVHFGYRVSKLWENNINVSYGKHHNTFDYFGTVTSKMSYLQFNFQSCLKLLYIDSFSNLFISIVLGREMAYYKLSAINHPIITQKNTPQSESSGQFAFGLGMNIKLHKANYLKIQTAITPGWFIGSKKPQKNTPPFNAFIHYAYLL